MTDQQGEANEYEQFRRTFFEECAEILSELEVRFANLHVDQGDREPLNAIFRAVHSIKAGAGAFGYARLVEFTHNFEAVLDGLRDGRIEHTDRVSPILIRAGDVLATLIEAAQSNRVLATDFGQDVTIDLDELLVVQQSGKAGGARGGVASGSAPAKPEQSESRAYGIAFKPHREMFRHANEPLLLFRELKQLGTVAIDCDTSGLPAFGAIDPEGSYLGWTIRIVTSHSETRLAEVFEFVEGECELSITPEAHTAEAARAHDPAPEHAETAAVPGSDIVSASEQRRVKEETDKARSQSTASIRVDLSRIDRLVNMVGELVITQSMLAQQISDLALGNGAPAIRGQEDLALLTRELQECVMAIRMQPVKSVFARMPRLVREVSAKLGKTVQLVMSGEQTEVDKTVIEELADPLTHMIRNAIDHGIEAPEVRLAAGKPAEGTIVLTAMHAGSNILIHVSDDGGGVDRDRLIAKAIDKGIIPPGSSLTEDEVHELLFAPGFSTAEKITDVSGRGVGMDVVRRNIINLGGRIQVQSAPGRGTRFTLIIPLTLAVLDGMVVAIGKERYILPLTSIIESYRPDPRHIRTVTGGVQVASIRGEYTRLVYLHRLFGVPGAVSNPAEGLVVLVETAQGAKIGIVVDELIGQQQVVIKSLLDNFDPVQGISGATILGNGRVALILDIEQISRMIQSGNAGFSSLCLEPSAIDAAA